jgi:hypothetical protein
VAGQRLVSARPSEQEVLVALEGLSELLRHLAPIHDVERIIDRLDAARNILKFTVAPTEDPIRWVTTSKFVPEDLLDQYMSTCGRIREQITSLPQVDLNAHARELTELIVRTIDAVSDSRLRSGSLQDLEGERRRLIDQRDLEASLDAARAAAKQAQTDAGVASSAAERTKQAAGVAGVNVVGADFQDFADTQGRTADWIRALLALLLGLTAGVSWWLQPPDDYGLDDLAQHASVALPLLGLSAYLLREASKHRAWSNWAHAMAVQLRTVEAFITPMDNEGQEKVRMLLARRVFGSPPDNSGAEQEQLLPEQAAGGVVAAIEQRLPGTSPP